MVEEKTRGTPLERVIRRTSMCLAVPMKVVEVDGPFGKVDAEGVKRKVSFQLLPDVKLGDYVLIHAGFAIEKINQEEARKTLRLLSELAMVRDEP